MGKVTTQGEKRWPEEATRRTFDYKPERPFARNHFSEYLCGPVATGSGEKTMRIWRNW